MTSNNKGFTLYEILVALAITSIGFLAMSQMQYLSLRQTTLAQIGSKSTNLLQSLTDRDTQFARIIHLMNSRVYLDSVSGTTITTQDNYCDGTPPTSCLNPPCSDPCTICPCDPLTIFTSDPTTNNTETTCAFLSTVEFDPTNIKYETNKGLCSNPACLAEETPCRQELFVVRRVVTTVDQTTIPQEINLRVTYAIKTPKQFADFNLDDPIRIIDTVVAQTYLTSAHIDQNWNTYINIPGQDWSNVTIPHIP